MYPKSSFLESAGIPDHKGLPGDQKGSCLKAQTMPQSPLKPTWRLMGLVTTYKWALAKGQERVVRQDQVPIHHRVLTTTAAQRLLTMRSDSWWPYLQTRLAFGIHDIGASEKIGGPFPGCPCNESPTCRGLDWGPGILETPKRELA